MEEPVAKELFNILSCPVCKGGLRYTKDKKKIECSQCLTKYPIEGGIPVLLPPKGKK
jgi:hypothetical protein